MIARDHPNRSAYIFDRLAGELINQPTAVRALKEAAENVGDEDVVNACAAILNIMPLVEQKRREVSAQLEPKPQGGRPSHLRVAGECAVDGCGRKTLARGLCSAHYQRLTATGDVGTTPIRPRRPNRKPQQSARAAAFLRAVAELPPQDDCIPWEFGVDAGDVPSLTWNGRRRTARRTLWGLIHGAPRGDHRVMTTCGNTMCVNPAHLQLVGMRLGERA